MKELVYSKVIIYHDETKQIEKTNLKGHVLLFVPKELTIKREGTLFGNEEITYNPLVELYNRIMNIRKYYNSYHKFHFNEISKSGKWTKYNEAEKGLLNMGVEALKSKNTIIFSHPLFCKIAIIFYHMYRIDLFGGDKKEKRLRYHETLLRMLLKGSIHYLYDKHHQVEIEKIISDGEPYHRKLSDERILWRLIIDDSLGKSPLMEYVKISPSCEIIHQSSQHKDYEENSEEYIHANMLQLADMFLGAVVHSCYKGIKISRILPSIGQKVDDKRGVISVPVKEMLDKRKRGKNFRYSSYYKSFSLSRAYLENDQWHFDNIMTKDIEIVQGAGQLTLLDLLSDGE